MINVDKIDFNAALNECLKIAGKYCMYKLEKDSIEEFLYASELYFYFIFTLPNFISAAQLQKISPKAFELILNKGATSLANYASDKFGIKIEDSLDICKHRICTYWFIGDNIPEYNSKNIHNDPSSLVELIAKYNEALNGFFANNYILYKMEQKFFSKINSYVTTDLPYNTEQDRHFVSIQMDNLAMDIANDLIENLPVKEKDEEKKTLPSEPEIDVNNNSERSNLTSSTNSPTSYEYPLLKKIINIVLFIFICITVLILRETPKTISLMNKVSNGNFVTQENSYERKLSPETTMENESFSFEETIKEGYALYNNNDYQGALDFANKLIEQNKNNYEAYNLRGIARISLYDFDDVASEFTKAIELNPNYAVAHYNRGSIRYEAGYYEEALKDLQNSKKIAKEQGNFELVEGAESLINTIKRELR